MTEAESDKVSAAVNELTWVLDRDLDATDERVRLAPTDRQRMDRARIGVVDMLQSALQKAETKVCKLERLLDRANSLDSQGEMFDGHGKPLAPTDEHGRVIETDRQTPDYENEPTLEGLEPINPVEEPTEEPPVDGPPVDISGVNWGVNPLRASDVMDLLLEQIRDGAKKLHAIDAVTERTQWTKQQVQAAWNSLVETGTIARVGSVWKLVRQAEGQAEEPTAPPGEAEEQSADPEQPTEEPPSDQDEEDDHRKAA